MSLKWEAKRRKKPRIALLWEKWRRRIKQYPRGTKQRPSLFSHKKVSGGCCPEDMCLEAGCGETTEYPGPIQGAHKAFLARKIGSKSGVVNRVQTGRVQVQNIPERGELMSCDNPVMP